MAEQQVKNIDPASGEVSMKPLLGMAVKEAVKLALIDCVLADAVDTAVGRDATVEHWGETAERLRAEWAHDVYSMPADLLAKMDPVALGQNVACRLFGTGGWMVNGVYSGNATVQQVVDASFARPDQDHMAELAFDLGLTPADDDEASPGRGT